MKAKTSFLVKFLVGLLILLACAACGSAAPTATATPQPTATPAPTATPSIQLGAEQRIEDQGFSFRPIPGYKVDTSFGVQMLAANADPDTGPAFMLVGGEALEGTTAQSLIESLKSDEVQVSDPKPITVSGAAGLSAAITRPAGDLTGRVVAVMVKPTHQFILFGVAPKAQWEKEVAPLFEAVLGSIKFFDIVAAAPPPTETAAPTESPTVEPTAVPQKSVALGEEYRSSAGGYLFKRLPGYELNEANGAIQLAPPNADPDLGPMIMLSGMTSVPGTSLEETLAIMESAEIKLSNQRPIQIGGVEGLTADFSRSDGKVVGQIAAAFPSETRQFLAMAGAPPEVWESTVLAEFQALLATLTFFEPEVAAEPQATAIPAPPPGFLWRAGGASSFDENVFVTMGGMDAANNLFYVADGMRGLWALDAEGTVKAKINDANMDQASDVQVGPDGNLYVAAWGSHAIFVFSPDGTLLRSFGQEGQGDGQFGAFSPTELAVGPDGRVYVYDSNKDKNDQTIDRIQIFSAQGKWLKTFPVKDEWAAPDGMDFGPDGILYTVSFIDREMTQYSANGEVLGSLQTDALDEYVGAQDMDIDQAGNFYLALWDYGVLKLDPQGNLVALWGFAAGDVEQQSWPEGAAYRPSGVAALPDGSVIAFSDSTGFYAYVTGFTFAAGTAPIPERTQPAPTATQPAPTPANPPAAGEIRQWAASANASSEYSNPSWSAQQATGAPNVSACGDDSSAWASADSSTLEWIELGYTTAVIPSAINIHQSFNPGMIIKVELKDTAGQYHEVYRAAPAQSSTCPAVLNIVIEQADYSAVALKISIDQRSINNWAEIDAVELLGVAADGSAYTPSDVTLDAQTSLPVMEGAQNLYSTEDTLNYWVKADLNAGREFYLAELPKIGWLLDLNEKGKCRDNDRCMGWHGGYDDPKTTTFFFLQGDHAYLTLNFIEDNGQLNVIVGIDPEFE